MDYYDIRCSELIVNVLPCLDRAIPCYDDST